MPGDYSPVEVVQVLFSSCDYCAGITRFSCYYQANPQLRDGLWYYKACLSVHGKSDGQAMRPVCDLCNFYFELRFNKKRFTCLEGKLPYCEGLSEKSC